MSSGAVGVPAHFFQCSLTPLLYVFLHITMYLFKRVIGYELRAVGCESVLWAGGRRPGGTCGKTHSEDWKVGRAGIAKAGQFAVRYAPTQPAPRTRYCTGCTCRRGGRGQSSPGEGFNECRGPEGRGPKKAGASDASGLFVLSSRASVGALPQTRMVDEQQRCSISSNAMT